MKALKKYLSIIACVVFLGISPITHACWLCDIYDDIMEPGPSGPDGGSGEEPRPPNNGNGA